MTREQISKVAALAACRLGVFCGERRFVAGLGWLAEHSPGSALSWRQRWYLDALLWRYRKQLAGRERGFELPTAQPAEADYRPAEPTPRQGRLLDGGDEPARTAADPPPFTPPARQARLL